MASNPKPDTCRDCLYYGDGWGFVPDEVPDDAEVVFVYQNPGDVEEFQGRPMIGPTGQMWRHQFLARHLPGVCIGHANVIKCRQADARGRRTNQLPRVGTKQWNEVWGCCQRYLDETLARVPTALVVVAGEHAIAALTSLDGPVLHLRGSFYGGRTRGAP